MRLLIDVLVGVLGLLLFNKLNVLLPHQRFELKELIVRVDIDVTTVLVRGGLFAFLSLLFLANLFIHRELAY